MEGRPLIWKKYVTASALTSANMFQLYSHVVRKTAIPTFKKQQMFDVFA